MWRGTHEKHVLLIRTCPCTEGILVDGALLPKHWIAMLGKCIVKHMAVLTSRWLSVFQGYV